MWLWVVGSIMAFGGIVMARLAFADEAFLAPVLGWAFVCMGAVGAGILVYKASTVGIVG